MSEAAIRKDSVPVGQNIFEEGEEGGCMYIVKEGQVDLLYKGKLLATVEKGGIFGEMALIDFLPRSATAVAKTDCKLVPVDEKHFSRLVQETPTFALQVMRVLVHRLRMMNETM
ncbi:MAG: cyclic nucleotide-binding domain-containing protein [Ignavibacteria bacterium]|nr:cyclic nucleotide-binding domain-containing protein [Ignavibacteria bacterium]